MTKAELVKLLSAYHDEQLILVEAREGGFDEPKVYITAVRGRQGAEFKILTQANM